MTGTIDSSQLEDVVRRMRALGVTKFGGIELGPDPTTPRPDKEDETQRTADAERLKQERDQRVRFGASGGPRPRVGINR